MHPLIKEKQLEIADLCRRYQVRSLAVFGSAARAGDFKKQVQQEQEAVYEA
jgi:predicted nucleotidyltransferase